MGFTTFTRRVPGAPCTTPCRMPGFPSTSSVNNSGLLNEEDHDLGCFPVSTLRMEAKGAWKKAFSAHVRPRLGRGLSSECRMTTDMGQRGRPEEGRWPLGEEAHFLTWKLKLGRNCSLSSVFIWPRFHILGLSKKNDVDRE